MNAYSLTYTFDKKKPLKTALLAVALGVDLFDLAFLISACSGDYIKFAYVAFGIAVTLALRLPTLKMTYSVKYVFKDGLSVYRIYPHRQELVFCLGSEFEIYELPGESKTIIPENVVKLYYAEGETSIYRIDSPDGSYALALDDYMLALILSFYDKKLTKCGERG